MKLVNNTSQSIDISLPVEEQLECVNSLVSGGDFTFLFDNVNSVTGLYDYDDYNPYWLKSNFEDATWEIELRVNNNVQKKTIDWGAVTLYDGLKLTSPEHERLLTTFKLWVTSLDNPRKNGGKMNKGGTTSQAINYIYNWINAILINGESLNLSNFHLELISRDFLMSILVNISGYGGIADGVYSYTNKVRNLLLKSIEGISEEECEQFSEEFPYIKRHIPEEFLTLKLTTDQRIKSCFWLHQHGYYHSNHSFYPAGKPSLLVKMIYNDRILPIRKGNIFPNLDELSLTIPKYHTEYRAIPNKERSEIISDKTITNYINSIKSIASTLSSANCSHVPVDSIKSLSLKQVAKHAAIRESLRTNTLPPDIVFNLIRNCFEFCYKYQESILSSCSSVLTDSMHKSRTKAVRVDTNHRAAKTINTQYLYVREKIEWLHGDAIKLISSDLKKVGVECIFIDEARYPDTFKAKRDNKGLFNLYNVLIGAIQILVGAVMARRQDEMIELKDSGNLYPNIDPSSNEGQNTDYLLEFNVKKTGFGGKHEANAQAKRPIPRSIALIIWKLEKFNSEIIASKAKNSKLSLFNNLDHAEMRLSSPNSPSFNKHNDAACDYFETPLVAFEYGEMRRYYVRQHQLRRFFALIFFWSKGHNGLETLRYMLAHSDVEHLYHYITENDSGTVLKGVKATYLVDSLKRNQLENIDELRKLIARNYGLKWVGVGIDSPSKLNMDYGDEDFETVPTIEKIREESKWESVILDLLENDIINLEPDFFTIERDGEVIHDFHLTLKIKEVN